jgi:hypothetical protein
MGKARFVFPFLFTAGGIAAALYILYQVTAMIRPSNFSPGLQDHSSQTFW